MEQPKNQFTPQNIKDILGVRITLKQMITSPITKIQIEA